jgi:Peptidase family S41/N-terminal domain of Peptidase_S41 in eukaryotic IRBP
VHNRPSSRPTIMSRIMIALPLLAACISTTSSHAQAAAATPPDTPAGHALSAWLDAFNSADQGRIEHYINTIDKHQQVDGMLSFAHQTGGFTLVSIERSEPDLITFRVHEKAGSTVAFGALQVAPGNPPTVEVFSLRAIPPDAEFDDPPLDAAERSRVIDGVTSNLTKLYVYPDVAAKMNALVQAKVQHGDYNSITNGAVFADALTRDLRAVSNDRHLHVDYVPFKQPATPPYEKPTPDDLNRMRQQMANNNCGFEKAEILPRNIGYLKFNMFGPPAICAPTASAAMNLLAHTRALIIDLRENGGGDPAMVDFIVSYLFDTHEHINDLYNRSDNETTQYWTLPWVPGERLTTQPVYVLTSHGTFSGAEEFTYDLKNLKRATIVGETTGGGAHPVRGVPIDAHFDIAVPVGRPINPVTKTDWEGTGITPDYKTSRDEALPTAIKLAEAKLQAEDDAPAAGHPASPAR